LFGCPKKQQQNNETMKLLKNSKLLALIIFGYGLLQRVLLDIAFWEKYGWHASHLTEIWFYCKVAALYQGFKGLDITIYLLRLLGYGFSDQYLLHAVSILAAILSSLTGVLIFYLIKNLIISTKKQGATDAKSLNLIALAAAFFYTSISSVQALSVVSFTHDLLQYPIMLGFLVAIVSFTRRSRTKKGAWKKNWYYLATALVLGFIGYNLNPVFLLALPLLLVYLIFCFLPKKKERPKNTAPLSFFKKIDPQVYFYIILIVGLILIRYVFYEQALQVLNAFTMRYRSIDLIEILGRNSKDLVPTDMDKKFLDIYLLCFFVPFGFYAAYKKREVVGPTLLIIGYFIASTVDRGSRILNMGMAMVASYALWYKKRFYILDYLMVGVLILVLFVNPGSSILGPLDKLIFFIVPLVVLWAFKKYFSMYDQAIKQKVHTAAVIILLLAPSFLTLFIYKYWVRPALSEGEYQMAAWLRDNTQKGERIFLNWGEEHYYDFLTDLVPINDLERSKIDETKIYWEPEADAVAYAKEHQIKYFLINSEDFRIQKQTNTQRIAYTFRGTTPQGLKTETLIQSFIHDLVYKPSELKEVGLIHEEIDRATEKWVRLFRVKEE